MGGTAAAAAALAVVYHDDPRQLPFDAASAAGPLLRLAADAETSHNAGLRAAAWGLFPRETRPDPPELAVTLWGRRFSNPLGANLKLNPESRQKPQPLPRPQPHP